MGLVVSSLAFSFVKASKANITTLANPLLSPKNPIMVDDVSSLSRLPFPQTTMLPNSSPTSAILKRFKNFLRPAGGRSRKTGQVVIRGFKSSFYRPFFIKTSSIALEFNRLYTIGPAVRLSKHGRFGVVFRNGPVSLSIIDSCFNGAVGSIIYTDESILPYDYKSNFKPTGVDYRQLKDWGDFVKLSLLRSPSGLKIAFAPMTYFFLVSSVENFSIVFVPSGALLVVPSSSFAFERDSTRISTNLKFKDKLIRGRGVKKMLFLGRKSKVRGVAKNSCDHPHGGNTKGILRPRTPWAKTVLKSKRYCDQNHLKT